MTVISIVSLVLAAVMATTAAILVLRQAGDRRDRQEVELDDRDQTHYLKQDRRRFLGGVTMIAIAVAMAGSAVLHPIVTQGQATWAKVGFLVLWVAVGFLLIVLLGLALLDVLATWRYARRHQFLLSAAKRMTLERYLEDLSDKGLPSDPYEFPENGQPNGTGLR